MTAGPPLVVMVAPNGARRTKADHPALPITPAELARTAAECREAGAAAIHIHVRDRDGRHSIDPGLYGEALAAIRGAVGDRLICQITTEAVGMFTPAQQMATVRAVRPESVSLAIRELLPSGSDDAAREREVAAFFAWMAAESVRPQLILYDADDLRWVRALRDRGVLPAAPLWLLFVLGRYSVGQRAQPLDLLPFLDGGGPGDDPWAVCAFGPLEAACALTAAALGGHSRIGFENNLSLFSGETAPTNAALVAQLVGAAAIAGRAVADADAARQVLFAA